MNTYSLRHRPGRPLPSNPRRCKACVSRTLSSLVICKSETFQMRLNITPTIIKIEIFIMHVFRSRFARRDFAQRKMDEWVMCFHYVLRRVRRGMNEFPLCVFGVSISAKCFAGGGRLYWKCQLAIVERLLFVREYLPLLDRTLDVMGIYSENSSRATIRKYSRWNITKRKTDLSGNK